jgi:hypothetical protein
MWWENRGKRGISGTTSREYAGASRLVQEFRGSGFKDSARWLAAALGTSLPFDITSDLLLPSSNRWTFEP